MRAQQNKERISQTEPNSSSNLCSLQDQLAYENFYSVLHNIKKEGVISDAQKRELKELLIGQDQELTQAIFASKHEALIKNSLIQYIKSHFVSAQKQEKRQNNMFAPSLEVKTQRNSSNTSSQNNPELGGFMKYLDDLLQNSPTKQTMFDKKQLQKIYKRLSSVIFEQCSPLPQNRGKLIAPLEDYQSKQQSLSLDDILFLHKKYKQIKSVYNDLLRLAQLFISDSTSHPHILNNIRLLVKVLVNADSFAYISGANGVNNSSNVAQNTAVQQNKRLKTDEDKMSDIKQSESIIQDQKAKDQEWLFFDSENVSGESPVGFAFTSETLTEEISALKLHLVEISELNSEEFPTIIAKLKSYDEQFKTYIFKFYNLKSEQYELFSIRYKTEESFANDKAKIVLNNISQPISQNQAFSNMGSLVVNSLQLLNTLQETSAQLIDLSYLFLAFGKNLLLEIFQTQLESVFNIKTYNNNTKLPLQLSISMFYCYNSFNFIVSRNLKKVDQKESKSQDAEERSKLFSSKNLILEDDYSDIIFECSDGQEISLASDPALFTFFMEISHYFSKYRSFLSKVTAKVFVYKFFLRNNYSTYLDFSKKGDLKFISQVRSSIEVDCSKLQSNQTLKVSDLFRNNKKFLQEYEEIVTHFSQPIDEQEKQQLKHVIEEQTEKQRVTKQQSNQSHPTQVPTGEQQQMQASGTQNGLEEENWQRKLPTLQDNQANSCWSPEINNDRAGSINQQTSANLANGVQNPQSNANKSFVSSTSKSFKPFRSYVKKPNAWFYLKSIPEAQIYVQQRPLQGLRSVVDGFYLSIAPDEFHSDSVTNFESFYQFDDILNSLGNTEFNDPRVKLILKKIYSKVNSITTEEKVQKEYIDTQIELFTTTSHRDRFTSMPLSLSSSRLAQKQPSKSVTLKNSPIEMTTGDKLVPRPSILSARQILHSSPAVTNIDDWDFDVNQLRSLEEKYTTTWNILKKSEFSETFAIPEEVYANFIKEMQKGYDANNNAFHNFHHGIAVMQSCYMLSKCKRAVQILKSIDIFTLILSGLCHDVKHTGKTNNFEIAVQSKLAIRYHDKSVLEQHHLATTFKILKGSKLDCNILQNLDLQTYNTIRRAMISNIMYTDIKQHFKLKQDFETYWKAFDSQAPEISQIPETEIDLLTGMIIHTADFTGAAKPFYLSRQWSEKVNKEFHNQYLEEGKRGVEQTAFMKDLDVLHVMAKAEKGFLTVIVLPLWVSLNDFYKGELQGQIVNLNDSIVQWGELSIQQTQKIEEQSKSQEEERKSSEDGDKASVDDQKDNLTNEKDKASDKEEKRPTVDKTQEQKEANQKENIDDKTEQELSNIKRVNTEESSKDKSRQEENGPNGVILELEQEDSVSEKLMAIPSPNLEMQQISIGDSPLIKKE